MSGRSEHRLEGLEPDNLLAFLALLGLLRALETARPNWAPRAYWDVERQPVRPVLVLREEAGDDTLAAAANEGVLALANGYRFDRDDLNYPREKAVALLDNPPEGMDEAVLGALISDGALREDKSVWPTPFCFLFGQGHQHFLSRLGDVPRGRLPSRLASRKNVPDLNDPALIARTLLQPWTREELTDGFRWDPVEDRRYALRADDPSGDPAGMQHGANRLAAIGLSCLPGAAVRRRSETRFLNAGTRYGAGSLIEFGWPLWAASARLAGVCGLLAHPRVQGATAMTEEVRALGVTQLYRARRISVGKFFNVERAERVA
jgi:hypothetical protein